jgi:hypothetical protein
VERFEIGSGRYQEIFVTGLLTTRTDRPRDTRSLSEIGSSSELQPSQQLINTWLEGCLSRHHKCRPWRDLRQDWEGPARLLDVGEAGSPNVRLQVVENRDGSFDKPYLTLTYYRGGAKQLKLTSDSVGELVAGIKRAALPKTFRDAVMITRQVGVRYLWIDSLCIFQDSDEDWQKESKKMGDIYAYSLMNISAAGADDSNGGLFFARDATAVAPVQVDIAWPLYDCVGTSTQVSPLELKLYDVVNPIGWAEDIEYQRLFSQALVVQESFFSRRTLFCCQSQLYWECREATANESTTYGVFMDEQISAKKKVSKSLDIIGVEGVWRPPSPAGGWEFTPPADSKLLAEIYSGWIHISQFYTTCEISRDSDKIVTFDVVGQRFAVLLGDRYVAGLLIRALDTNLTWGTQDPLAVRIGSTQAPTWSWGSVKGDVDWDSDALGPHRLKSIYEQGGFVEYIDHHTPSLSSDTAADGPLTTWLKVKAFVISASILLNMPVTAFEKDIYGSRARTMCFHFDGIHHVATAQFDDEASIERLVAKRGIRRTYFETQILSLPVRWTTMKSGKDQNQVHRSLKVQGLLLYPSGARMGQHDTLIRVGRFTLIIMADKRDQAFEYLKHRHESYLCREYTLV